MRALAAPALLALLALPLAACSGEDDAPLEGDAGSGIDEACAPGQAGEFAPASSYYDFGRGSFAIQYELSDGTSECLVMDEAIAEGSYEVAGQDMQVYVDLGTVDLGLTVDIAAFVDEGAEPLSLGPVPGTIGFQLSQHYYSAPDPAACDVTLVELTDASFAGSFECDEMPGYADFAGPFGGETTDLSVVSATGWWIADTA